MSTSQTGGPRRRRIAGERRTRAELEQDRAQLAPPDDKAPADKATPVSPSKRNEKTTAPAKPSSGAAAPKPKEHPTGWWGSRLSLIVLAAILVFLLALTGFAALGWLGTQGVAEVNESAAVERSMKTAPAAAESAAAAILAYDHKSLDADQDQASRFMTDEFAAEYSETFEKVVRPAAESNRAKVTATVQASSVIRATEDTARVLLFVDQATTSTANDRPQIALNRVVMSMVREDDRWQVADISSY